MNNLPFLLQIASAMVHPRCRVENRMHRAIGCLVFLAVFPGVTCRRADAQVNATAPSVSANTSAELAAAARGVERISAHRGAMLDRPENTIAAYQRAIAAYQRAIEAGATAVEIDVRTSQDGKLVIMHDAKVDRTTNGSGRINDLTWAELAALDAGSWFDANYASERVPSLDQVLQVCHGRIGVHLDLKEEGEEYADRVVAAVKAFGEPTRTIAAVRTVEQARQLQKRMPEMKTLIFLRKKEQLDSFLDANVNYVRPQIAWLEKDPTLLTKIREGGAKIHFDATTGTPENVLPLLRYRPESLLCDDPEQLVRTLAQLQAKD